ncbi:pyrroloquinoline quinone biosynthesis peptide chaperone PqqD [Thermogemmatispora carboxidivorans]|uniref:pyrroloquinoline quinone biosynthesis peptide chaperone PqqD n=1 Tax=Thermogemmatispora carboxidivorans TaxID=1382306 RepID=UPI0009DDF696|nr:pyrroloquinoline quinone biosynthesis peptide chaperone PqqD [Thermogemmatispora carboxidivorans]
MSMSSEGSLLPFSPTLRPRLLPRARLEIDRLSQQPVLLYPEGVMMLNETAAAILQLCNGEHTLADILRELASRYEASPEQLQRDVYEYLRSLRDQNLIAWLE